MKKNSCTPINPKKIFMLWPKKNSHKQFDNKKNSCGSKIPLPTPHNFSNGPSLRSSHLHAVLKWQNPLHGDDKNKMILALFRRWSSKSSKSSTERLIIDSFQGACLNVGCKAAKKKHTHTRKDNLSVTLSSLPLSHRFMLSLSRVIH